MARQVERIDESRSGVRVIVHRQHDGSTVEADCQCFGSWMRIHSNPSCPVLAQQTGAVVKRSEPASCRQPSARTSS